MAVGAITGEDKRAGLANVDAFGVEHGAATIDIVLKSERPRRGSLTPSAIRRLIDSSLPLGERARVERLRVTGREDDDSPQDVLDLISHHQKQTRQLPINPTTRKIDHELRWSELGRVRGEMEGSG